MSNDYDWEQEEYEYERKQLDRMDFKTEILKEAEETMTELRDRIKELEAMIEFNTNVGNLSMLPWDWKD